MTTLYELRYGSYYLIRKGSPNAVTSPSGEHIVLMCDQVAMCFDVESGTLFKHGAHDVVQSWYQAQRLNIFNLALLVFPAGHPVEDINRCLTTSGHIGEVYKRLMLAPEV